jgi:hypothetical protein
VGRSDIERRVRCAVLYNAASTNKNEVAVFTFGSQSVTAGTFTLTMPTNDALPD